MTEKTKKAGPNQRPFTVAHEAQAFYAELPKMVPVATPFRSKKRGRNSTVDYLAMQREVNYLLDVRLG